MAGLFSNVYAGVVDHIMLNSLLPHNAALYNTLTSALAELAITRAPRPYGQLSYNECKDQIIRLVAGSIDSGPIRRK